MTVSSNLKCFIFVYISSDEHNVNVFKLFNVIFNIELALMLIDGQQSVLNRIF